MYYSRLFSKISSPRDCGLWKLDRLKNILLQDAIFPYPTTPIQKDYACKISVQLLEQTMAWTALLACE
jgi:hypothetical protein